MVRGLKNIPLRLFREYLEYKGLKLICTKGGHEVWSGKELKRPVIIQSHLDPIPEFIIKNNLRTIGADADDFYKFMKNS